MWKLRRSLELHPQQSEAIRLYEQLVSEPQWWPTRSYLQRVIDEEFHRELDVITPSAVPPQDGDQPIAPEAQDEAPPAQSTFNESTST